MAFSTSSKKLAYVSSIDNRIKERDLALIDDDWNDDDIRNFLNKLYTEKNAQQKYYIRNKDKIKSKQHEWIDANPEKIKKLRDDYYEKNKDRLNARKREKITCECGAVVSRGNIYNHRKSKAHLKWVEEQKLKK